MPNYHYRLMLVVDPDVVVSADSEKEAEESVIAYVDQSDIGDFLMPLILSGSPLTFEAKLLQAEQIPNSAESCEASGSEEVKDEQAGD
jgi:hypothetical protein